MTNKDKIKYIMDILSKKFGKPKTALNYNNEYQLMVAVVLSAQCTDARVNIVTEELFKLVEKPEDIDNMELSELEKRIYQTGFYKNKALNLKKNARILIEKYNSKLPQTLEELIELPGVGRKTANVLLGDLWNKRIGIVVDTHVKRLSNLIGFVNTDNPEKIEKELIKIIPKKYWYEYSHYLILQGRDKCIARRPKCSECEIRKYCDYGRKKGDI
ncbi:endonuclease III [Pseudostreptobacillus hongkongensis]|uniref:endonuclease III n=1 Tax=Pseudostreptobacillus hongkongensis TaxID=1162717 RepID=UPI000835A471|nr:endonuclease III [Pseudostreptobacillus hongkongensis]